MESLKVFPGDTVICVNPTGWESLKAGMLLEVRDASERDFKVSSPLVGEITVLKELASDFLRLDYIEVAAGWSHGVSAKKYLCLASRLTAEMDKEYVVHELAPDLLCLHGLMDSPGFRSVMMEKISRDRYLEVAKSSAIDQKEWDFSISREGDRISVNLSVLEGLGSSLYSERRLVSSVMMESVSR